MKKLSISIYTILLILIVTVSACTDLNEDLMGSISPENYYQNEQEALSSLAGVYQRMEDIVSYDRSWQIQHLGTDELAIPSLASGGWGGYRIPFANHSFEASNSGINRAWNQVFSVVGAANATLDALESSPTAQNLAGPISEIRALRAYAYFYAMDYWGNVPIFTEPRVEPNNLPSTNTRAEVFEFVESELLNAVQDLPSINEVSRSDYYPRLTKEAVYTLLATIYLNGEVYSGEKHYQEAVDMADKVIDSGGYILEPEFGSNFAADNHTSRENIFTIAMEPFQNALGNHYFRGTMHPSHQIKYGTPFTPANGFKTFKVVLDRYEANDIRRNFIVHGPQNDFEGNPLQSGPNDPTPLELIPLQTLNGAADNEGYRVLKYVPDGNWVGRYSTNDVVITRYADVLLIKAEALFRLNGGANAEALQLVNLVRERSNASTLTNLDLNILEEERARELVWEGHRRRDMIRFGSYFTGTWKFKTDVTPESKGIYPIPQPQIDGNPNLTQNPGY